MLLLSTIPDSATPEFSLAWQLYEEAFPEEERRSLEQQEALLANSAYQFISIIYEGEFAGLFGVWQLPECTFLEHFAINAALRGKGVGAKALQTLISKVKLPVFLEVEPPLSDISKRRISFYERVGFHVNDFEYRQPPYDVTKTWVKLLLMSYPTILNAAELEEIKAQLYRHVYGQAV